MKRYIFTFLYILSLLGTPVVFVQAEATQPVIGEYVVLAPLPGTTVNCTGTNAGKDCSDINSYLGGFLGLAIGIGAVIAMIMLGFYGFQYALSDSASVKMANSAKLWEIVQGLLLIIASYAIIYTINPALLEFSLEITAPKVTAPAVTATSTPSGDTVNTSGPMSVNQILQSNAVRESLQTEGVLTYAGPCTLGQTRGCVNLNGLNETAKDGLIILKRQCGSSCTISITGGTEPGHDVKGSHPKGLGIDLTPNTQLNTYIGVPNPGSLVRTVNGKLIGPTRTLIINGRSVNFTYEVSGGNAGGTSTGNHWHIDF